MGLVKLAYSSQFCYEIRDLKKKNTGDLQGCWRTSSESKKVLTNRPWGLVIYFVSTEEAKFVEGFMAIHGLSHTLQKMMCNLLQLSVN